MTYYFDQSSGYAAGYENDDVEAEILEHNMIDGEIIPSKLYVIFKNPKLDIRGQHVEYSEFKIGAPIKQELFTKEGIKAFLKD